MRSELKARLKVSVKFWSCILVPMALMAAVWLFATEIVPRHFLSEPEANSMKNENAKSALLPPRPCAENPSLEQWMETNEVRQTYRAPATPLHAEQQI